MAYVRGDSSERNGIDYEWAVYPPNDLVNTIRKVCDIDLNNQDRCKFPTCTCGMSGKRALTMLLAVYLRQDHED